MIANRRRSILGVIAALLFGCSAAMAAAPKYKIQAVRGDGAVPAPSTIYAINDDGVMVGLIHNFPNKYDVTMARYAGPHSAAELLADGNAQYVSDINAAGDVLARQDGVTTIWRRDGSRVALDNLQGASSFNNNDWVVGWTLQDAVIWHDGAATVLEDLDGSGAGANSINDAGLSAGSVSIRLGDHDGTHEAAIWDTSGKLQRLTVPGASWSDAWAINNRNHVVGNASDGAHFAFFYDGAAVTRLPAVNGRSDWSVVTLNDRDEVLGNFGTVDPVLVRKGVAYLLRDLLEDQGKDWEYLWPYAMNNLGQIVGWGRYKGKDIGFIAKRVKQ